MNKDENFYVGRKHAYVSHSRKRFHERYGNKFDKNLINDIKLCIKADINIVFVKAQSDIKNHYIIFYEDYYSLIFDKSLNEIVTFLPIHRQIKNVINKWEKGKLKKYESERS